MIRAATLLLTLTACAHTPIPIDPDCVYYLGRIEAAGPNACWCRKQHSRAGYATFFGAPIHHCDTP